MNLQRAMVGIVGAVGIAWATQAAVGEAASQPAQPQALRKAVSKPPRRVTSEMPPTLPANALPVPLVRQATGYSCGPSSLQAILFYWQVFDGGESELYSLAGTTEEHGTEPEGLVRAARSFGLRAEWYRDRQLQDLRDSLARGETVIVSYQAWRSDEKTPWRDLWDDGHYSVLVAMDERNVYLMDPSSSAAYGYVPLDEFEERWHDVLIPRGAKGPYEKAQHMIVVVSGKTPMTRNPGPVARVE